MKNFDHIMLENDVTYAISFDDNCSVVREFGDRKALKYQGVYLQYLSSKEIVAATWFFLSENSLPKLIMQGHQCCMLNIFNNEMLAVFFESEDSVFDRKKKIKKIKLEVESIL